MVSIFYVFDNGYQPLLLLCCYQVNINVYTKMALDFVAGCLGGKNFNIKMDYTGMKYVLSLCLLGIA